MFVLLKVLLFFFRPLIWIVILLAAALLFKNPIRQKRLLVTAFGLLLFFSNPFICTTVLRHYEAAPVTLAPAQRYTVGIVLGGFIAYNLADDKGYFNQASDRFVQTALLYKTGHIQKILIPAGNGYIVKHNFREADFIKERFLELGVPATDIYTDGESKNTLQNAINSKQLLDSLHLPGPFLLISSALHLPRAQKVFYKQGLKTDLYPCDFLSKNVGNNFIEDVVLPSATALRNWDNIIKEWVGIAAYTLTGKG